jgi:hypothetical protein
LPLGIVGIGSDPQPYAGAVDLLPGHEILAHAGRLSNTDEQHAGRHRVERAGVAHATNACQSADMVDDVVGSGALWLIEVENSIKH